METKSAWFKVELMPWLPSLAFLAPRSRPVLEMIGTSAGTSKVEALYGIPGLTFLAPWFIDWFIFMPESHVSMFPYMDCIE